MISRLVLVSAAIALAAALCMSVLRFQGANKVASSRERAWHLASTEAREVLRLRAANEMYLARERPTEDVIGLVNQSLADAGISSRRLQDLEQESDTAIHVGPPELRRQTVRCRLEPVTIDELGRFLEVWAREHQLWTPVRIEILHTGRDDLYACRIALAATYVSGL